jgi:hypothetical protein
VALSRCAALGKTKCLDRSRENRQREGNLVLQRDGYLSDSGTHCILVVLEGRHRRTFAQRFVGNWLDSDGLLQQAVEELARAARFAPVEAEREFIEGGIEMLRAYSALVGSQQPVLGRATAR